PPPVLDLLEASLLEMVDELGLGHELVDIVVVGSLAYGIGRPHDSLRPSDLDIVVYMRALSLEPAEYLKGFAAFREAARRRRILLQQDLGTSMDIDIKVDTRPLDEHVADPDWVGF